MSNSVPPRQNFHQSPINKSKRKNQSNLQHNFIVHNTLKRNKEYLNIQQINKHEQIQEKYRRMPSNFQFSYDQQRILNQEQRTLDQQINKDKQNFLQLSINPVSTLGGSIHQKRKNSIDSKINKSFLNTTAALSDKVEQNINQYKIRISATNLSLNGDSLLDQQWKSALFQNQHQNMNQNSHLIKGKHRYKLNPKFIPLQSKISKSARNLDYSGFFNNQTSHKKIKGMSLDKYCSRQQYYQNKQKMNFDQRLFNNFSLQKPDLAHTKDFKKCTGRESDFSLGNLNLNLQYNTQKIYEDYYYKKTPMQCNFNYKFGKKQSQRKFFAMKRDQDQSATQIQPQKIQESYQKATKPSTKKIDSFYANTGRQLPSQLDMRNNTNLTNYWITKDLDNHNASNFKIKRKIKEYNLRKMKDDLIEKKLDQIKQSKRPYFQRNQICDQKYFRVFKNLQENKTQNKNLHS